MKGRAGITRLYRLSSAYYKPQIVCTSPAPGDPLGGCERISPILISGLNVCYIVSTTLIGAYIDHILFVQPPPRRDDIGGACVTPSSNGVESLLNRLYYFSTIK